jgi:hypothetical protein
LALAACIVLGLGCSRLERIDVEPKLVELGQVGQVSPLAVKGFDQDGKAMERVEFTFASSNPGVATVDAVGNVTALKSGSATIEVASGEHKQAVSVEVKVPARLTLSPAAISLQGVGSSAPIEARVLDDADRAIAKAPVTFSVKDGSVASVDGQRVVALGVGTTTITAALQELRAEVPVTVTMPTFAAILIKPVPAPIPVGGKAFLEVSFADTVGAGVAGVTATFATSNEAVAVANGPVVTGVGPGTAQVLVTSGDKTASVSITVVKP